VEKIKSIYTSFRLYLISSAMVVLFVLGQFYDPLFLLAKLALSLFVVLLLIDAALLFGTKRPIVQLSRMLPERFSNGDDNPVSIWIHNNHNFTITTRVIDEIPAQFQIRDFCITLKLKPGQEEMVQYKLKPKERGIYEFGVTNVLVSSPLNLWVRRYRFGPKETQVAVYPSFLQMRKYEFLAISNQLTEAGLKRVRKAGSFSEFDQIKDYVAGDNYRTINWKATARRSKLMVNQYQEERSQQVFNVIDMGRSMQMPFDGMTLLDYSINSSLIMSNTALLKYDKAGLITFNKKIDAFLQAERGNRTIAKIQEWLYKQSTGHFESDYALLAAFIHRNISHRSLIILYTNFETLSSLYRQLPYLKHISKKHLLMVVLFENSEIERFAREEAKSLSEVYTKTIAEKFIFEKKQIARELMKNGILSVLTKPEALTANLINRYLEIKTEGKI